MTFWRRDDFKTLNKIWKSKLKDSGFIDAEDEKGNLSQKDHRTTAFDSVQSTINYYAVLNSYLQNTVLEERDRKILELYSSGIYIKYIVVQVGWSDRTVRNIINKHKKIFLNIK